MRTIVPIVFLLTICLFSNAQNGKSKSIKVPVKINTTKPQEGDTIKIRWNTDAIGKIEDLRTGETLPNLGNLTFVAERDTVIKLGVWIKNKFYKKIFRIQVFPVQIMNFQFGKGLITDEENNILSWKVINANTVMISSFGNVKSNGAITFKADSSQCITLTAINKNGKRVSKQVYLNVKQVEGLNCPDQVYKYTLTNVSWKYKLSQKVIVNGKIYKTEDSIKFFATKDTSFNISVFRNNGKVETVTKRIKVTPGYIKFFWGPQQSAFGADAILSWEAPGMKYVTIDGDKKLPSIGFISVRTTLPHAYTLKAFNGLGKSDLSRTIKVDVYAQRAFIKDLRSIYDVPKSKRIDFDIISVDRTNYPKEIILRVAAIDQDSFFVTGLAEKKMAEKYFLSLNDDTGNSIDCSQAFKITEVFDSSKTYNFGMALDNSGSMRDEISTLEKACINFIKKKLPEDHINLVKFDDTIWGLKNGIANTDSLLKAFKAIPYKRLGRATALYAASDVALRHLNDSVKDDKILIIFSDGYENSSFIYNDSLAISALELVKEARIKGVRIITIGYGNCLNAYLLYNLSHFTDGNFYHISSHKDINRVFVELPRVVRNYYEIRYKPKNTEDGVHTLTMFNNNNCGSKSKTVSKYLIGQNVELSEFSGDAKYNHLDSLIHQLLVTDPIVLDSISKPLTDIIPGAITMPQKIISFEYNKYKLDSIQLSNNLIPYYNYLLKHPECGLVILGHTDLKGSENSCMELSYKRAEEVRQLLISKGIYKGRLKILACGKKSPLWNPDKQKWQSAENRRVEVVIVK
jgi:outer membrane protein OmpA-like peptidoglycan-associated protein